MATQEKNHMCENVVRKLTVGESLEDAEKLHLALCAGCMAQVVKSLDEPTSPQSNGLGMASSGTNGDLARARPDAKKALEQGRRVFEREFGISLLKK